jgi:hypothetical protein
VQRPQRALAHRLLVPAAIVGLALLVTACGDDDTITASATTAPATSDPSTSAPATTAPAANPVDSANPADSAGFAAAANEACDASHARIGALIGPVFAEDPPDPEAMQAALEGIVAESRDLADELSALAAPADLQDDVDRMIEALQAGTDGAEAQGAEAFFASEDDPWASAGAIAAEIGLDACAGS